MNLCTVCGEDFASLAAFDRHRVGRHAYSYRQGLRREPPREDGRRCLDPDEMRKAGLERDGRGHWRIALTDDERERLVSARGAARAAASDGLPAEGKAKTLSPIERAKAAATDPDTARRIRHLEAAGWVLADEWVWERDESDPRWSIVGGKRQFSGPTL